ncbi:MAG TPA: hypothetical protein VNV63_02025 [Nitrospiria bacterium]|nr:hypothetical protein [Nitrospiria bacterium]
MTSYTPPDGKHPYLSIVVSSRNDDHGGNILGRMRLFQKGLLEQSRRYRFPIEVVFVEWNPPADRPRLHEVLPKPAEDDCLLLRYISVPNEIHRRYRRAPDIDLFQMTAKNVGIRRARGAFILCTNIDLLFSDALFCALAERSFKPDTYYRANRCDVPDGIDPRWDLAQQLAWCERNVIRRLGRDRRYRNINLELLGQQDRGRVLKWFLDKMAHGVGLYWNPGKELFYQLDLFACGDFTLMSREAWNAIQGYLELDLYSLHIDSLGLIAAAALGYKQHVFPLQACTYHIDHTKGWETLAPLDKVRFLADRPALDYSLIQEVALHAFEKREPFNLNPPTWGFSDVELEELVFPPPSANDTRTLARSASAGD